MLQISHFCEFLLIFCQIRSKIGKFGKKVNFFALFGMKLKKSAKNCKNEKMLYLIRCFKSKKQIKINF